MKLLKLSSFHFWNLLKRKKVSLQSWRFSWLGHNSGESRPGEPGPPYFGKKKHTKEEKLVGQVKQLSPHLSLLQGYKVDPPPGGVTTHKRHSNLYYL